MELLLEKALTRMDALESKMVENYSSPTTPSHAPKPTSSIAEKKAHATPQQPQQQAASEEQSESEESEEKDEWVTTPSGQRVPLTGWSCTRM